MSTAQQQEFIEQQQREHQLAQQQAEQREGMTLEQIEVATNTTEEDNEQARRQNAVAAAQFMEASHPYRLSGLTGAVILATR